LGCPIGCFWIVASRRNGALIIGLTFVVLLLLVIGCSIGILAFSSVVSLLLLVVLLVVVFLVLLLSVLLIWSLALGVGTCWGIGVVVLLLVLLLLGGVVFGRVLGLVVGARRILIVGLLVLVVVVRINRLIWIDTPFYLLMVLL
jgi:hypothetical protein